MSQPNLKTDIIRAIIVFLLGGAVVGLAVHAWHTFHPVTETRTLIQKVPVQVSVPVPIAKEVAALPTEQVAVKQVRVYKEEVKKQLHLPKDIQDAPEQRVISAATVQPDDHLQTVTTVLDTSTGESRQFVQAEPLPWLAADRHGDAGLYVGYQAGIPTVRAEARQGLIQVKMLHLGLMASADQPLNGGRVNLFGGVGAWGRW